MEVTKNVPRPRTDIEPLYPAPFHSPTLGAMRDPAPPRVRTRVHTRVRHLGLLALGLVFSLLSCGREVTGPGSVQLAHAIAFQAEFPGRFANVADGAGSVVPFNRIRIVLRRTNGTVALDRVEPFAPGTDSIRVDLRVTISSNAPASGEPLDLFLSYLNADGDTVFRGGPVAVAAVPAGQGEPPAPVAVPLTYTGPGASAISVAMSPETLTVVAGSPFLFTAIARDAQQAAVAAAPIVFTSLDTVRAPIQAPGVGAGLAAATRGIVRIVAELAAGSPPDTSVLVITPRAASLSVVSGGAQSAPAGAALSDSVRLRLLATDGLGIAGVTLSLAVTTGGGSISPASLVTDANGRASLAWRLGSLVGAQSVTASATGVSNLVIAATAGDPPLVAAQLVITQHPNPVQVVGQNVTPALRVEARDVGGVLVPGFTDSVTIALGVNPSAATLGGTVRVAAIAGVATLNAWTVSALGSGYTVVASAAGLTSATSNAFDVGGGGPALLAVTAGNGQTGFVSQSLTAPIVVRVTDALALPQPGVTLTFA